MNEASNEVFRICCMLILPGRRSIAIGLFFLGYRGCSRDPNRTVTLHLKSVLEDVRIPASMKATGTENCLRDFGLLSRDSDIIQTDH